MLTAKQARFAQLIGMTTDQTAWACYMEAYDARGKVKTATEAASRLLADSNIAARVEELRAAASKRATVTLTGHLESLASIRDRALAGDKTAAGNTVKNYGAAVQAETTIGKHSGVAAPDKHQDVTPDVPAEDAITELCTQAGVVHETARALFMQGLDALKLPYSPGVPEPTQQAPDMVQ